MPSMAQAENQLPQDLAAGTAGSSTTTGMKQRQRKYHRRSRNGCKTCKQRHVRCDEKKPLCSNCFKMGGQCGYPRMTRTRMPHTGSGSGSEIGSVGGSERQSLSPTMSTFGGVQSAFGWYNQSYPEPRLQPRPGPMEPRDNYVAVSNPGFLHAGLLLSEVHHIWATGDFEAVRVSMLYNKLEAYQYLGMQVKGLAQATSDESIATLATLALVEASLWERTGPGTEEHVAHLQELQRVIGFLNRPISPADETLFQRILRMATSSILYSEYGNKPHDLFASSTLVPALSILFMAVWPAHAVTDQAAQQQANAQELLSSYCGWMQAVSSDRVSALASAPAGSQQFHAFARSSRCSFMSYYFYMAMLMRRSAIQSVLVSWLVDQMLDEATRTERSFAEGSCDRHVWFWTLMVALAAVAGNDLMMAAPSTLSSSSPSSQHPGHHQQHYPRHSQHNHHHHHHHPQRGSTADQVQLMAWRNIIADKIRLANALMGFRDWDMVRDSLRTVAWLDGFDGEADLRQMWNDIAISDSGLRAPMSSGGGGIGPTAAA